MTYDTFMVQFKQRCPEYYLVKTLPVVEQQAKCDCMLGQVMTRWPNMKRLEDAIYQLDRAPRGEGDFVPSAIRMTAQACNIHPSGS